MKLSGGAKLGTKANVHTYLYPSHRLSLITCKTPPFTRGCQVPAPKTPLSLLSSPLRTSWYHLSLIQTIPTLKQACADSSVLCGISAVLRFAVAQCFLRNSVSLSRFSKAFQASVSSGTFRFALSFVRQYQQLALTLCMPASRVHFAFEHKFLPPTKTLSNKVCR